jgi:hypothetical protein
MEQKMIPYFQGLGRRIERAWLAHNYDEESFPQLALEELARHPPSEHVGIQEVIDWLFSPFQAFQQPNINKLFGEPPVMLFQGSRFYIEALFWLSGTTEIHEHAFSGAFAVLAGSSVHSHWKFTPDFIINSRMLRGRLERVSTEILRPGGMRSIRSGERLIHQLFHLEPPSVTIVVRTYVDRHRLPQYRYMPPGLAIDSDDRDPTRTRRLMLLEAMARGQIDGLSDYASRLIESGDLESIYYTFSMLSGKKVDKKLLEGLYDLARQRHGDIVDLFRQVCRWERRNRLVIALRSRISDPEQRFLLALLMLMPDRDAIFEAIRLQFPDLEPLVAIETWLSEMSGKETIGFDFNDENRLIFRSLVEGLDEERLLRRLRSEFHGDSVEANRDRLLDHAKQLAKSELFHPLLSRSPLREESLMT